MRKGGAWLISTYFLPFLHSLSMTRVVALQCPPFHLHLPCLGHLHHVLPFANDPEKGFQEYVHDRFYLEFLHAIVHPTIFVKLEYNIEQKLSYKNAA